MYLCTRPWSDGTTGIKLSPLELLEKLAAIVPLPRAHLVRYGGCLAPHSTLRAAIIPTPRQQGMDSEEKKTGTPYWHWARLLGRVLHLDGATCPFCRRGSLQIIAAITQWSRTRAPCSLSEVGLPRALPAPYKRLSPYNGAPTRPGTFLFSPNYWGHVHDSSTALWFLFVWPGVSRVLRHVDGFPVL